MNRVISIFLRGLKTEKDFSFTLFNVKNKICDYKINGINVEFSSNYICIIN